MKENPTYRELLEEALPDKSSPFYKQNADYALGAIERGATIADVVEQYTPLGESKILDIGCGEGGIAIAFALRGGEVTALDAASDRIERMKVWASEHGVDVRGIAGDALDNGLPGGHFDIIVCNDFMEHISRPQALAYEIDRLLKDGGHLYLSNQNRLSIFGFLRDPHLSLFGITWMPRWVAKFYVEKIRRRAETFTIFTIPTHSYLKKIFSRTSVELTLIPSGTPAEKIRNPHLMSPSIKRSLMLGAKKLGMTRLGLWLVGSRFNQFFLDMLTYVGEKKE